MQSLHKNPLKKVEDSFINHKKWPIKPLNGDEHSKHRKEEIRGKISQNSNPFGNPQGGDGGKMRDPPVPP